jgi:hypothetical protein
MRLIILYRCTIAYAQSSPVVIENSVGPENAEVAIVRAIMVATKISSLFIALFAFAAARILYLAETKRPAQAAAAAGGSDRVAAQIQECHKQNKSLPSLPFGGWLDWSILEPCREEAVSNAVKDWGTQHQMPVLEQKSLLGIPWEPLLPNSRSGSAGISYGTDRETGLFVRPPCDARKRSAIPTGPGTCLKPTAKPG